MELKHAKSKREIVLASILKHVELFFGKMVKIEFRSKSNVLFLQEVSMIAHISRNSISFTSISQME